MQRIFRTTLIGLSLMGLAAFAQEMPQQPVVPVGREAIMARRQAMQKLTGDFSAAVKNGSFPAEDQQKAQRAIAQLGRHVKGAPKDPQARHEAMKTVRQMSNSAALRPEDRELLAKDLAAATPSKRK